MIKVAISYCPDLAALQLKLKALYEAGKWPEYIGKEVDSDGIETGRYIILKGLRTPLRYSEDGTKSFGLFKCNPYDEEGNLTGIMLDVYPEIQVLQYGTNRSLSDCPWMKLTEEQWLILESIYPRQPILGDNDEPTGGYHPRRPYGECATKVCP